MTFTIGGDYLPSGPKPEDAPKHPMKVVLEKRGKSFVTIIKNFPFSEAELSALAADLKKAFGCGGTIKDKMIELQGSRVEEVKKYLDKWKKARKEQK